MCTGGGGDGGGPQTDKHLPPSAFTEKSRPIGFGVFVDIWSMQIKFDSPLPSTKLNVTKLFIMENIVIPKTE